eukprot:352231-Chlamydomonas_euryale.AAC.9
MRLRGRRQPAGRAHRNRGGRTHTRGADRRGPHAGRYRDEAAPPAGAEFFGGREYSERKEKSCVRVKPVSNLIEPFSKLNDRSWKPQAMGWSVVHVTNQYTDILWPPPLSSSASLHPQAMGWSVINVTFTTWDALGGEQQREAFLRDAISDALDTQIAPAGVAEE